MNRPIRSTITILALLAAIVFLDKHTTQIVSSIDTIDTAVTSRIDA